MTLEGCCGVWWDLVTGLWAAWLLPRELLKLVITWMSATCTHTFRENYQGFQGTVWTAWFCTAPSLLPYSMGLQLWAAHGTLQVHRSHPRWPCLLSPNLLVQFAFMSTQFRPIVSQVLKGDCLYQLPMFSVYITISILTSNISTYLG